MNNVFMLYDDTGAAVLCAAELGDDLGTGEMEGCEAECAPGEGSEGDGEEVAELSVAVGDDVKKKLHAGEADERSEEAAGDLGKVEAGERDEGASVGEDGKGAGLAKDRDV
jgi:hypothetical protein